MTGIEIGMSRTGTMKEKRAVSPSEGTIEEDRGGAEQLVRVAIVVGVDRDQAGLGVGGALIERRSRQECTG